MTDDHNITAIQTPAPHRPVRDHRDAETFVAEWMHWAGFKGAQVTQATADGGLDVVAPGSVAQVKFGTSAIGRPAIQGLYGAAIGVGKQGLFFSAGGYTRQAEQWADSVGVALFTISADGDVVPKNQPAERIVGTAKGLPPPRDPTPWIFGVSVAVVLGFAFWGASIAGWFGFLFVGAIAGCFVAFFVYLGIQMFGTAVMFRELSRRPRLK